LFLLAKKQIKRWLERLRDRKIILEDKLTVKQEQWDEFIDYLLTHKEIHNLEEELNVLKGESATGSHFGEDKESCKRKEDMMVQLIQRMKVRQFTIK